MDDDRVSFLVPRRRAGRVSWIRVFPMHAKAGGHVILSNTKDLLQLAPYGLESGAVGWVCSRVGFEIVHHGIGDTDGVFGVDLIWMSVVLRCQEPRW